MKRSIYFLMLIIVSGISFAGGGGHCEIPKKEFPPGSYEIRIIDTKGIPGVKQYANTTLNKIISQKKKLFRNANIKLSMVDVSKSPRGNKFSIGKIVDPKKIYLIGLGEEKTIKMLFENNGITNGVIVPLKATGSDNATSKTVDTNSKTASGSGGVLSNDQYYEKMMEHAVYRGLPQLNGEKDIKVTSITLEHILTVTPK